MNANGALFVTEPYQTGADIGKDFEHNARGNKQKKSSLKY
jgi:hypothetical protein